MGIAVKTLEKVVPQNEHFKNFKVKIKCQLEDETLTCEF